MLRHATALALLIVSSVSIEPASQPTLEANSSAWLFPVDPSANVDESCMFDCARSSNYDNSCYWKCGIDPLCKWGSMLQCADAKPDRQMNCVISTGCLDFVEHYIRKKQQTEPHTSTSHSSTVIRSNLEVQNPLPRASTPQRIQLIKHVVILLGVVFLLAASIFLTWLSIRHDAKSQSKPPKQVIADCYVLLDESVSDF